MVWGGRRGTFKAYRIYTIGTAHDWLLSRRHPRQGLANVYFQNRHLDRHHDQSRIQRLVTTLARARTRDSVPLLNRSSLKNRYTNIIYPPPVATMPPSPAALLAHLRDTQKASPLSILHLAEPILDTGSSNINASISTDRRATLATSTASAAPSEHDAAHNTSTSNSHQLTPSSLSADLQHYRELFAKLRFSYLEQVTKEKYLRSIVGDPPVLVSPGENAALESTLATMKSELKAKKTETDALVVELEGVARTLAARYESVQEGTRELETLPAEVAGLREQVELFRDEVAAKQKELGREDEGGEGGAVDPRYAMGVEATRAALEEQRRANAEIDREIEELERRLPGKVGECERVERELEETERRREEVTRLAREVKRIREEGGRDLVGERGRWYTAQEAVLKGLLQI
jgi:Skp family chaperone for outer membrane proteins